MGCSLAPRPAVNQPTTAPRTADGPPTVAIAAPPPGVFGWVGYPFDLDVRGADPWGIGVSRLDLRVGGELVDSATTPGGAAQLSFATILEWVPSDEGNFAVSVIAYRPDGSSSDEARMTIGILPAPETPAPTLSQTPTPSPTGSGEPSATPEFTPDPSATPTPKPSQAATPADVAVNVNRAELPAEWVVGQAVEVIVYVSNLGESKLGSVTVKVSAARGQAAVKIQGLEPGQTRKIRLKVTPQLTGHRTLRVEATLPKAYLDYNLDNNVWSRAIEVLPGAEPTAEPTPTEQPTATPTAAPTDDGGDDGGEGGG